MWLLCTLFLGCLSNAQAHNGLLRASTYDLAKTPDDGATRLDPVSPPQPTSVPDSATANFTVSNRQILSMGQPIFIKGVCYSPAPLGVSAAYTYPYGDYFTEEYREFWERDFPAMREMGANAVRIYGWNNSADHSAFFEYAHAMDFKVIVTFYLGTAEETPVGTPEEQKAVIDEFSEQVVKYAGKPSLLGWSFGNELNGVWNGFLGAFNETDDCGWTVGDLATGSGGCYNNNNADEECVQATECVYKGLFGFIDRAAEVAHTAMGSSSHLIISSFADVDLFLQRVQQFEDLLPHLDAWGAQLYMGQNFGTGDADFLAGHAKVSTKPLIVTEYGVDSYHDICGSNQETVCTDTFDNPKGSFEDEKTQAEWGHQLSSLLLESSSKDSRGSVAGGFIMAWVDEQWKTAINVKGCYSDVKFPKPGFDPSKCDYKAHVDCPNPDIRNSSLCGYPLGSPFDQYVNEGFFGIMRPWQSLVAGKPDELKPKLLYTSLQVLWGPPVSSLWIWITMLVILVSIFATVGVVRQYNKSIRSMSDENQPLVGGRGHSFDGYGAARDPFADSDEDEHSIRPTKSIQRHASRQQSHQNR